MIGLAALSGSLLMADPKKIAPELRGSHASGKVKVIVQYKQAVGSASLSNIPLLGGVVGQVLSSLNAVVTSLSIASLESLSNMADVSYISPDRPVTQGAGLFVKRGECERGLEFEADRAGGGRGGD
jgi:hypothetical protein